MIKLRSSRTYRDASRVGRFVVVEDKDGQLPAEGVVELGSPHDTAEGDTVFYLQTEVDGFWVVELGDADASVRLFRRL